MTLPTAEAQPTPAPGGEGAACFYTSQIQATHLANPRTLYFRISPSRYYRMDFATDCVDMGEPLILHPFTNSGQICGAIGVDVSVRGTHQRCMPISLKRMTPEEVAAVPKKDLP
jgi:hypothetical protein